jgi:glycosyltransferase involved in cell wall biosynthesis
MLSRALASALAQTAVSLEVVVVDDGSVDETARSLAAVDDPRLRVVSLGVSHGVSHARNRAIAEARGEWIAFLDDDDVWAPEKLQLQLAAADGVRNPVIGYAGCVYVDADGNVIRRRRTPDLGEFPQGLAQTNLIGGPSGVIARTEAIRALDGFDPLLSTLADWDLWLRLVRLGEIFATPEIVVGYRLHEANMHAADVAGIRRELAYLRQKHAAFAEAAGSEIGSAEFSLWLVKRYRESGRRIDAAREYLRLARLQRRPRQLVRAAAMLVRPKLGNGIVDPTAEPAERTERYGWLDSAPDLFAHPA